MSISEDNVRKIAALAHLSLTDDELKLYQDKLGQIVEFVDQLKKIPIPEMANVTAAVGSEREDTLEPHRLECDVLGNAPSTKGSSFVVPRIIE